MKKVFIAAVCLLILISAAFALFYFLEDSGITGLFSLKGPHIVKSAELKYSEKSIDKKIGALPQKSLVEKGTLALEKQFMEEDMQKIEGAQLADIKPTRTIKRDFRGFSRTLLNKIIRKIEPTYSIGLSAEDRTNPAFASVDMEKYRIFQRRNPGIFRQIIWANAGSPDGKSIIYSKEKMESLAHYIALLESNQSFPLPAPPIAYDVELPIGSGHLRKFYTEEQAWNMFIPHIAVSLYVEVNSFVPWSLKSYDEKQLELILDSRNFINYWRSLDRPGYTFALRRTHGGGSQGITDWNPFFSYDFMQKNHMIKNTQEETIYALTNWIRENLKHEAIADAERNQLAYGYNGSYPVDKILSPPESASHWTQGCSGTSSLYSALLQIVNIPVSKNYTLGGHLSPIFPTVNLALGHGDDPYSLFNKRGLQEVPVQEIFYTIDGFVELNNPVFEPYGGYTPTLMEQTGYNNHKRIAQTAYAYMAYSLLQKRAFDVRFSYLNWSSLGDWWMHGYWKPVFDNETFNSMLEAMDNEILRIGEGNYTLGHERIIGGL